MGRGLNISTIYINPHFCLFAYAPTPPDDFYDDLFDIYDFVEFFHARFLLFFVKNRVGWAERGRGVVGV